MRTRKSCKRRKKRKTGFSIERWVKKREAEENGQVRLNLASLNKQGKKSGKKRANHQQSEKVEPGGKRKPMGRGAGIRTEDGKGLLWNQEKKGGSQKKPPWGGVRDKK